MPLMPSVPLLYFSDGGKIQKEVDILNQKKFQPFLVLKIPKMFLYQNIHAASCMAGELWQVLMVDT